MRVFTVPVYLKIEATSEEDAVWCAIGIMNAARKATATDFIKTPALGNWNSDMVHRGVLIHNGKVMHPEGE